MEQQQQLSELRGWGGGNCFRVFWCLFTEGKGVLLQVHGGALASQSCLQRTLSRHPPQLLLSTNKPTTPHFPPPTPYPSPPNPGPSTLGWFPVSNQSPSCRAMQALGGITEKVVAFHRNLAFIIVQSIIFSTEADNVSRSSLERSRLNHICSPARRFSYYNISLPGKKIL